MNALPTAAIPSHVPPELVFDFDFWHLDSATADPFEHFTRLEKRGAPPIFYTPANGGHWVFRRFDDVFEGYRNWEAFASFPAGIPRRPAFPPVLVPVELDPPEHQQYRNILAPLFAPAAVRAREEKIRGVAARLIDAFAERGHCDYVGDFSAKLPTGIFLGILGLPEEELDQFLIWENMAQRPKDLEEKELGYQSIYGYLHRFVAEKRAANPDGQFEGGDVISVLLRHRHASGDSSDNSSGHELDTETVASICNLLYLAGLDTVLNTMAFIFRHLARTPAARQHIRDNPDKLPMMTDEFLRFFATPALSRRVRHDMEFHGVLLKQDDMVLLPTMLSNRDPAAYDHPEQVDLTRTPKPYLTFGAGPHRCLGAHLAKTEIIIAIEEWFKRIPEFTLDESKPILTVTGHTIGLNTLPLVWKA